MDIQRFPLPVLLEEPILTPDLSRFVIFPIQYPELWNAYKTAQASFWTPAELDFTYDSSQWKQLLTEDERTFLSTILGFFASADGIVVENLATRFCAEVQVPEARCFYGFQIMMENIHGETYSLLIQELVDDAGQQASLFAAVKTMPTVKAKAEWCMRWMESPTADFATRLVAFAIVEGVFFCSSFAAFFWVRTRGLLPALCLSNELIARDESMHTSFACLLYKHLKRKAPTYVIRGMVAEAVELEKEFFAAALPRRLNGISADSMKDYVEYVGDFILEELGLTAQYGKRNPFPFMETSAVNARANFFERGVSDYIGAGI